MLESLKCFHCGQQCYDTIFQDDKAFCCVGCKAVFEILDDNNLCEYYAIEHGAGVSQKTALPTTYDYLDDAQIRKKVLRFDSKSLAKVTFNIPAIHCISCIWLLENLRKLNEGVLHAEVTFGRKIVSIDFDPARVKLSVLANLLSSLGYSPLINLEGNEEKKTRVDTSLIYRLAIAGFCFGNIMLFSFPEYLGLDKQDEYLMRVFSLLNLVLSIPVFFIARKATLYLL